MFNMWCKQFESNWTRIMQNMIAVVIRTDVEQRNSGTVSRVGSLTQGIQLIIADKLRSIWFETKLDSSKQFKAISLSFWMSCQTYDQLIGHYVKGM